MLAESGKIDIYYGDETQVSQEAYVPYGWQFPDENVSIPTEKGQAINCLGFISRNNNFVYKTTKQTIDANFVLEFIEDFSWKITKLTVLVLDNAPAHAAKKIKKQIHFWNNRGLFIFYLPPYSPKLNIAEILWHHLKYLWIKPQDYLTADSLILNVNLALAAVGKDLKINFAKFNNGLI
jgi:transposase